MELNIEKCQFIDDTDEGADFDPNVGEPEYKCEDKVEIYCCKCDTFYCNPHSKNEDCIKHPKILKEEYFKCTKTLDNKLDMPEDFKSDFESSNILYVSPITRKVEKGLKWLNTGVGETDPFLLVGVVGPTGAGKSTLIRYIADGNIPVTSNNNVAATSDINCYNGVLNNEIKSKFLIFDSEGKGADAVNQTIMNTQISVPDISAFDYRRPYIDTCYPRLLYLFSDVLVYVFNQTAQQSQNYISDLVSFASESAAESINQLTKPHLVLVFNKSTNIVSLDVEEATKKVFQENNPDVKKLKTFYQSLTAIFIPPGKSVNPNGTIQMILNEYSIQMNKFKNLVNSLLESVHKVKTDKNIICDRAHAMVYISKAINVLNENPSGVIDIYKMSRSVEGVTSYIFEYFEVIYNLNIKKDQEPIKAFDNAFGTIQERVMDIIYLYCKRNGHPLPTKGQKLPPILIETFKNAHSKILNLLPCNSVDPKNKHIRCETLQGRHHDVDQHQANRTEKRMRTLLGIKLGEKEVRVCYKWESAGHVAPDHYKNLSDYAESELGEKVQTNRDSIVMNPELPPTNRLCYGCLLDHPSQSRKCGHMFCIECCQDSPEFCAVCKKASPWSSNEIPKFAGTRILSLEGIGGVAGIAQAILITRIEALLFNIPISKLVDLIVGTGSGGIIALGVSGEDGSATRMVEFYKELKNQLETYTLGTVPFFKNIPKFCWKALYKRESFDNILRQHLVPNQLDLPLLTQGSTPGYAQVAVTATTTSTGDAKLSLFTSYHTPGEAYKNANLTNTSIFNAAIATSATKGFIDPKVINGIQYTDGSRKALSPCIIAYQESKRIFKRPCDIILTITTGIWPNNDNQHSEDIVEAQNKKISTLTKSAKQWSKLENIIRESGRNSYMCRLAPKYTKDYPYDSKDKIDNIKADAIKYYQDHEIIFLRMANQLLASQFYLDEQIASKDDSITLTIKCRLSPSDYKSSSIKELLMKKDAKLFSVEAGCAKTTFLPPKENPFFEQTFTIHNVQRDKLEEIDIKFNIIRDKNKLSINSEIKDSFSISSFPMKFIKLFENDK